MVYFWWYLAVGAVFAAIALYGLKQMHFDVDANRKGLYFMGVVTTLIWPILVILAALQASKRK